MSYSLLAIDFLPPELIGKLLSRVVSKMADGHLSPLRHRLRYSLASTSSALRALAQASHAGKVVVTAQPTRPSSEPRSGLAVVVTGATVAVTGGLGGLGLLIASWMVSTGMATRMLLLGRTGKTLGKPAPGSSESSGASDACWLSLTSSAAEVVAMASDTSVSEDALSVAAMAGASSSHCGGSPAAVESGGWSVDVLIHAAGVLTDAMLPNQTVSHLRRCVVIRALVEEIYHL